VAALVVVNEGSGVDGIDFQVYGVSPEWVKSEIARRADAAALRLAPLVDARVMPAVELFRELDYATTFYSLAVSGAGVRMPTDGFCDNATRVWLAANPDSASRATSFGVDRRDRCGDSPAGIALSGQGIPWGLDGHYSISTSPDDFSRRLGGGGL
jgi:hypothetical protein